MNDEEFYNLVASLLGVGGYKSISFSKRTRWNNRHAGNGRYEGFGIIRIYGDNVHISLRNPIISKWCKSKEEAIAFLQDLMQSK